MGRIVDITGERFGRLVAVERLGRLGKGKSSFWRCLCDWGTEKT